jgi:hypothetical protein
MAAGVSARCPKAPQLAITTIKNVFLTISVFPYFAGTFAGFGGAACGVISWL